MVYAKLHIARKAKKLLDAKSFYGGNIMQVISLGADGADHTNMLIALGILHISYAPEFESVEEVQEKFQQRRAEVQYRIMVNQRNSTQPNPRKRKASVGDGEAVHDDDELRAKPKVKKGR